MKDFAQGRIGITGGMGSGKTTVAKRLRELAQRQGTALGLIEVDRLRADILETRIDAGSRGLRAALVKEFGEEIKTASGGINRRRLSDIIFFDAEALRIHDRLLDPVLLEALEQELACASGLVLVDWALFAEKPALELVNYNIIYLQCLESLRLRRLLDGDLPDVQVIKRMSNQLDEHEKLRVIQSEQAKAGHGALYFLNTDNGVSDRALLLLLEQLRTKSGLSRGVGHAQA